MKRVTDAEILQVEQAARLISPQLDPPMFTFDELEARTTLRPRRLKKVLAQMRVDRRLDIIADEPWPGMRYRVFFVLHRAPLPARVKVMTD